MYENRGYDYYVSLIGLINPVVGAPPIGGPFVAVSNKTHSIFILGAFLLLF